MRQQHQQLIISEDESTSLSSDLCAVLCSSSPYKFFISSIFELRKSLLLISLHDFSSATVRYTNFFPLKLRWIPTIFHLVIVLSRFILIDFLYNIIIFYPPSPFNYVFFSWLSHLKIWVIFFASSQCWNILTVKPKLRKYWSSNLIAKMGALWNFDKTVFKNN